MTPTYIKTKCIFDTSDPEETERMEKLGLSNQDANEEERDIYMLICGESRIESFFQTDQPNKVKLDYGGCGVYTINLGIDDFKAKLLKAGCVIIED